MQGQMSLDGFAEVRPTDRLFFALFPDDAARDAMARLTGEVGKQRGLRGEPLKAGRLHVTLHHLGDHAGLPAALVADAKQAAEHAVAAPFDVVFSRVASFSGRSQKKPCVLLGPEGDSPLQRFRKQLGDRLIRCGLGKHVTRDFTPHVTLLYDRTLVPPQVVAPISWTVREFALVHSLLGKTEHRILQRWALRE